MFFLKGVLCNIQNNLVQHKIFPQGIFFSSFDANPTVISVGYEAFDANHLFSKILNIFIGLKINTIRFERNK